MGERIARVTLTVLLALLAVSSPAWAGDCPLDLGHGTGWVVFSDHYMLAFRPDPPLVEVGQPFTLILNVCTRGGDAAELVSVEGERSETQTPMKAKPTIVPGNDGRYRAEGLVFNAPGHWDVTFDVRSKGESERLSHEIVVKQ